MADLVTAGMCWPPARAGLELPGTQRYIQQIFYGAALVAAITIPTVNRERFFKRKWVL